MMTIHRKCYQVLKPEIEFHILNEIYAALRIRTHIQKRQHFYAKTTNANVYRFVRVIIMKTLVNMLQFLNSFVVNFEE